MCRGRTAPAHRAHPAHLAVACVALALSSGFGARPARAEPPPAPERRLFLRLGVGPAFSYESYRPQAPVPGGSYFGFGPALDVAVGWRILPGLVVGGALQSVGIFDRDERYLGRTYGLADTLHLVDTLGVLADYTFRAHPRLHVGATLGALALTDVDTDMGGAQTGWGLAMSVHAGLQRPLRGRWAIGVLARLTFYQVGSSTPPPESAVTGVLPALLLTFTRG